MEVSFSFSFKRVFKKRIKANVNLERRFWQKLEQFVVDPFHPSLKTHKLSGKLRGLWSFSVDYDKESCFTLQKIRKLYWWILAAMTRCINKKLLILKLPL